MEDLIQEVRRKNWQEWVVDLCCRCISITDRDLGDKHFKYRTEEWSLESSRLQGPVLTRVETAQVNRNGKVREKNI